MNFEETALPGVFVVGLERLEDERGFFARSGANVSSKNTDSLRRSCRKTSASASARVRSAVSTSRDRRLRR